MPNASEKKDVNLQWHLKRGRGKASNTSLRPRKFKINDKIEQQD